MDKLVLLGGSIVLGILMIIIVACACNEGARLGEQRQLMKEEIKQCVLDMNYRPDCKYLIYEDLKQNKQEEAAALIMPVVIH